ncbi:hypothetical protein EIK77_001085 [Talaromyces pinophilus]|nr:hypothetical protein EIK77_001085 [Talaromyces pinophilus]
MRRYISTIHIPQSSIQSNGRMCQFISHYILQKVAESPEVSQHARESAARTLSIDTEVRNRRPDLHAAIVQNPNLGNLQSVTASSGREQPSISVYDCRNSSKLPGVRVRSDDQRVRDRVVNNAFDGLQIADKFYSDVFAYKVPDGSWNALTGSVHFRENYNNAMWDGQQMIFGDGDGEIFDYFADSLDVIVHEITHGVTQYTANLQYEGQSGALNESISDVFACMAEQWYLDQTAEDGDWLLGQNLFPVARKGSALRSLKKPGTAYNNDKILGKDPQPGHMRDYNNTRDDNGGVHLNSGIPNHAFYLVATTLGGRSWDQAGHIWFKTLTDSRLRPTATFSAFAGLTVDNAQRLYGNNVGQAVKKAWEGVGV